MIQAKQFSGIMDLDSSNETIAAHAHRFAKNVRFFGKVGNLRPEDIPGTNLIINPYLPATDNNQGLGAFYDELKQRVFWFNFNSGGLHGIYMLDVKTKIVSRVVLVGYNTDGDILGFTLNGPIYNVKMLYGDDTQGDILFFNNSQKEPCKVNVTRALSNGYGTIMRSFLDVAKEIPEIPPAVTYEDDNTITVNNLRKKLFKFKYRFLFDDNDKSCWSSQGELPLPINYTDTAIDKDPTKNARIALVLQTGASNVKKIEIASALSLGNVFSDFFLVHVVDKANDSIPDNDIMAYRFFNDQAYDYVDVDESIQLFDLVPLQANALEFLNGNVPVYGGILEGYDLVNFIAVASAGASPQQTTQYPFIFAASQSGNSGFGTGDIHIIVIGKFANLETFNVYTTDDTITYTASAGNTSADIITGLSASATGLGYTVVSSDTENLIIIKSNESLQRVFVSNISLPPTDSFAYDWNSVIGYAGVYLDEKGRSNGANKNVTLSVQTINYQELLGVPQIPRNILSISSRPPLWARYFQILRTKNLSKSKFIYWVSDRTFKDADFAYIGIENLNTFIKDNPSASFLAYDFATNDRIRFVKILSDGTDTIYTNEDFEIQSQVLSPTINGILEEGQFLKIALPATSGSFDFGTSPFFNYLIQLYTPAQSVANGLDVYYEFGERYAIGNPGTVNAFHQGMLQNQTADLVTPATFEFTRGDDYYRIRNINTGAELNYTSVTGERNQGRITLGVNFVSETFSDSNLLTGNSPLLDLAGFNLATDNSRWLIKIVAGTYTFRIKGSINVTFNDFGESYSIYLQDNTGTITYLLNPQTVTQGSHVFTFDTTFQLTSTQRIFIFGYSYGDFTNSKNFSSTDITITRELSYAVGIIDPNFSDFFQSQVNSNGRAWVVQPNTAQVFNPTLIRWGLANQVNTNINQTNRFYPLNFDEIDREKGQIQRFKVRERILRIFQERGCAQVGIYSKFLQDSGNTNLLTTTDDIITKNNVQYYLGVAGLGNQPTSLVSGKIADYIADPVRGYQWRLSGDGLIAISELYLGQFYIRGLLTPYNDTFLRTDGSKAKILGVYDYLNEQYICVLQAGSKETITAVSIPVVTITTPLLAWAASLNSLTNVHLNAGDHVTANPTYAIHITGPHSTVFDTNTTISSTLVSDILTSLLGTITGALTGTFGLTSGVDFTPENDGDFIRYSFIVPAGYDLQITDITSATTTLPNYAFSFNEPRNAYESFYDYAPEWILGVEELIYSWKDGQLYSHDNQNAYNTFYGTQYDASVKMVMNDKIAVKKVFNSIAYQSNKIWVSDTNGDINTSMINPQTGLQQISQLKDVDYEIQENIRYAAFLRDANSGLDPIVALVEGDVLNGVWVEVNLIYKGSEFSFFFAPYVNYQPSPRNF